MLLQEPPMTGRRNVTDQSSNYRLQSKQSKQARLRKGGKSRSAQESCAWLLPACRLVTLQMPLSFQHKTPA